MTPRRYRFLLLAALTFCTIAAAPPTPAKSDPWNTRDAIKLRALSRERAEAIDGVTKELDRLIVQAGPRKMTLDEQAAWRAQSDWLKSVRSRLADYHEKLTAAFGRELPNGAAMVDEMAAMNMQFLALREASEKESRKFQTLSNASKARHDIAMNAIRNLR
jgi:bifunctional pyridoxal-dependent enzyme with beta-cystathionase and maltose regulon repressor activities